MGWMEEARKLAEDSPYAERMIPLIDNPRLGTRSYSFSSSHRAYSNCHGTSLFVLGLDRGVVSNGVSRPKAVSGGEIICRLNASRVEGFEESNVVSFWWFPNSRKRESGEGTLLHTATVLGRGSNGILLFHQEGIERPFELSNMGRVLTDFSGDISVDFHYHFLK